MYCGNWRIKRVVRIPKWQVGEFIGKGGQRLKTLQDDANCSIWIEHKKISGTEAIVEIVGHRLDIVENTENEIKKISLDMTARKEGKTKAAEEEAHKCVVHQPEIVEENVPDTTVIPL